MSDYNQQQSQSQQQQSHSQQSHGFVQCITIREFWGDANLKQLCFKLHIPIEVDFSRPPQNGWHWGRIHHTLQGWCPEWSITPVGAGVPSSLSSSPQSSSSSPSSLVQCNRPPLRRGVLVQPAHSIIPPHQSQQSRERNSLRRSSDYVTPLPRIVEGKQENDTTNDHDVGLLCDQRTHDIMDNGSIPSSTNTVLADTSSSSGEHQHHYNEKKNPFEHVPDATITTTTTTTTNSSNNKNNKWNSGMKKLFSHTKIGIVNSNNKNNESLVSSSLSSSYQNPSTPKQEILEDDGTDTPQLMNNNTDNHGRLALVETEGHITNDKNEATSQLSTTTNEIADQLKTTTSNFSQQLSHWKRSPFLLGMSSTMNNTNTKNNNNNHEKKTGSSNNVTHHEQQRQPQQDEQQAQQKNQRVKVVTTNNNQEPEPRSSSATTTTTTKKYQLGGGSLSSSFPFPTLLPRSLLSKEQPPPLSATTYCERNGNEQQTLVEENRRQASHTRMNIYS